MRILSAKHAFHFIYFIICLFLLQGCAIAEKISYQRGLSPLIKAVTKGDNEKVKALIGDGYYIEVCDEKHHLTPLFWAVIKGRTDTVKLLLEYGASTNVYDRYGLTPAFHAVLDGETEILKLLLDHGANANIHDKERGRSILTYAIGRDQVESVKALLEHGADVNDRDAYSWNPLFWAITEKANPEIVDLLLRYGVNVEETDRKGRTPLDYLPSGEGWFISDKRGKKIERIRQLLTDAKNMRQKDSHQIAIQTNDGNIDMSPPTIIADPSCGLAKKISEQAERKFEKDQKEGLRLFIKAHDLCPGDASFTFNLGLAYYRYGSIKEAEKYLTIAVDKDGNQGKWLNLLACVMMENRSDRAKALEYAKKAGQIDPESAAFTETLIRAYLENGQLYNAVSYGNQARKKWSGDSQITTSYDTAVDAYIAYYLKKSKEGNQQEAIAGRKKADFDPEIVNAYCWVLSSAGQTEEALAEVDAAKSKFRGEALLTDTFKQIMDGYIQLQYQTFKLGKRSEAIMAVAGMKDKYPSHQGLKEAYERMFNAVLAEADTIAVPERIKIASNRGKTGDGARLLSELQAGSGQGGDRELTVDVDIDIPRGAITNRNGIAVIIGNGAYRRSDHGIPDVDYAIRDAAYMKEYVINVLGYSKENVIYELNVTKGDLGRLFGTGESYRGQLFNWVTTGQSDVFVYYVGHGAPDPTGKGAFLMPVEADADYITASGYSLDTFYDNLERIPAKSITVVLDACFSGDSGGGILVKKVSPAMLKTACVVRNVENTVVFTSAGKDQVSHWYPEKRHGLFTYFFMKGLRGEADTDKNSMITVGEMKDYLKEKVTYRARRMSGREQTPIVIGDAQRIIARLR